MNNGNKNFMKSCPLAGIRIISMAEQFPGPYATMLLADLGADVILVERPNGGDPSRRFAGLFASLNRNKRSVVLDLKNTSDKERFLQLVDTADVVMEGFRPGVMKRLGLDAEVLRHRKPSLIFTSISSFGQNGPLAGVAGHDLSIQGVAGMIKVPLGQESRDDVPSLPMADIASGMFAALSIVTALFSRTQDKEGCTLDVSMLDSLVSWMTPFLVPAVNNLPRWIMPPVEPAYGIFLSADSRQLTLSIAGEDQMWRSLCELLDLPQYADLSELQRSENLLEIDLFLRQSIMKWRLDDLFQALENRGIAFGPVLDTKDVLNEPQLRHRGILANEGGPDQHKFIRQPVLFNGTNFTINGSVPGLGEHNNEIFGSNNGICLNTKELP